MTYNTIMNLTEEEKRRITELHDLTTIHETLRKEISTFRFTPDKKYVLFEGNVYSTETGDLPPLMEAWSLSDILHTVGDVASAGMDFVIPGSGAVIDTVNAVSYIIEAQFKNDPKEKTMLYVMGAITFAFVIIPGALQGAAIPLKRFVKTGVGANKPIVMQGLKLVSKYINKILLGIPSVISRVLKSKLGRRVLGKYGLKLSKYLDFFTRDAKIALAKVLKTHTDDEIKAMEKASSAFKKQWEDDLVKAGGDYKKAARARRLRSTRNVGQKIGYGIAKGFSKLSALNMTSMKYFFKNPIRLVRGRYIIKKLGFAPGKSYAYVTTKGVVQEAKILRGEGVGVFVQFKNGAKTNIPLDQWLRGTIEKPWALKGYVQAVPLFVKRFADYILPDGSGINEEALNSLPDLDPSQTSIDSIAWLRDSLAQYEGDAGQYTANDTVSTFQKGLMALGYQLSRFGADGKFGPETRQALSQFQTDASLNSSMGVMDRITAQKIAFELRTRSVPNTEDLQNTLNNI